MARPHYFHEYRRDSENNFGELQSKPSGAGIFLLDRDSPTGTFPYHYSTIGGSPSPKNGIEFLSSTYGCPTRFSFFYNALFWGTHHGVIMTPWCVPQKNLAGYAVL